MIIFGFTAIPYFNKLSKNVFIAIPILFHLEIIFCEFMQGLTSLKLTLLHYLYSKNEKAR